MEMVAFASLMVPLSGGVLSLVGLARVLTVMVGAVVSIVSSLEVPSVPALPATSVAVTATLKVPVANAESVLLGRVQVPLPLLVAVRVCPLTVTLMVAPASFTAPLRAGVVSLVVRVFTVTVGAVTSMVSSLEVLSVPVLLALSVDETVTL